MVAPETGTSCFQMCTSLIFHGKKTIYHPFLVDEKGYFFPKLPYEIVTVKDKIVTVKDKCPTHSVLTVTILCYGNGKGLNDPLATIQHPNKSCPIVGNCHDMVMVKDR